MNTTATMEEKAMTVGIVAGCATYVLFSGAVIAHVLYTNLKRQRTARANNLVCHVQPQISHSSDQLPSMTDAVDSLPSRALQVLNKAQASARKYRRAQNIVGAILALFVALVYPPLIAVQMANGQLIWPWLLAFALVWPFGNCLKLDPMMPRLSRTDMGSSALFAFPIGVAAMVLIAVYTTLTPNLYGICSTDEPECARAAWIANAVWVEAAS